MVPIEIRDITHLQYRIDILRLWIYGILADLLLATFNVISNLEFLVLLSYVELMQTYANE